MPVSGICLVSPRNENFGQRVSSVGTEALRGVCVLQRLLLLPISSHLLFSHPVVSDSSAPHGLQHARLPCPSPSPGARPRSCALHQ